MKKFLTLLAMSLVLLSCTKQEIYEDESYSNLTVYVNGKELTKAVPTTDPKLVENTINKVVIGVFKSDGTVKTIKEFTSVGKSVTMRVANLSTTDKVLCAINNTGVSFSDCKTINDFNNKEITLDNSLTSNTVDIIPSNLPMYGEGTVVGNGDNYTSDINAYHLNTKVTLNALTIALPNGGTFTPKEIFLINNPGSIKFSYANPFTSSIYYHGALNSSISGQNQKLYLGSSNINSTVNQLFFYTSPNNSTKSTKLVIFGTYDADGNGGSIQSKNTYYPITIDKTLLPNKNYILNVSIKGQGVDNPTDDLNYSNLIVTINANNFEDISKDFPMD